MVRKLIIVALLFLYGLTGSVAAFAGDGDCAHSAPVPHAVSAAAVLDGDRHAQGTGEQAQHCSGLCHLLSAAPLQDEPGLAPPAVDRAVPPAGPARWHAHSDGVPTPPPNVVSSPL